MLIVNALLPWGSCGAEACEGKDAEGDGAVNGGRFRAVRPMKDLLAVRVSVYEIAPIACMDRRFR